VKALLGRETEHGELLLALDAKTVAKAKKEVTALKDDRASLGDLLEALAASDGSQAAVRVRELLGRESELAGLLALLEVTAVAEARTKVTELGTVRVSFSRLLAAHSADGLDAALRALELLNERSQAAARQAGEWELSAKENARLLEAEQQAHEATRVLLREAQQVTPLPPPEPLLTDEALAELRRTAALVPGLREQADLVPGLRAEAGLVPDLRATADLVPGLQEQLTAANGLARLVPDLQRRLGIAEPAAARVPGLETDLRRAKAECSTLTALKDAAVRMVENQLGIHRTILRALQVVPDGDTDLETEMRAICDPRSQIHLCSGFKSLHRASMRLQRTVQELTWRTYAAARMCGTGRWDLCAELFGTLLNPRAYNRAFPEIERRVRVWVDENCPYPHPEGA
jgi:hypothetical protein